MWNEVDGIPGWLQDLMQLFDVPWPDIDQNALYDLGTDLLSLCGQVSIFGSEVDGFLRVLVEGNSSQAVTGLKTHWDNLNNGYLQPFDYLGTQLNRYATDGAGVIAWYKSALLGDLTVQLGTIAKSIAEVGLEETVGRAAVRKLLDRIATDLVEWCLAQLASYLFNPIRKYVQDEIETIANRVADKCAESVAPVVEEAFKADASGLAPLAGELRVSVAELQSFQGQIFDCFTGFGSYADAVYGDIMGLQQVNELSPDTRVRVAVQGFFDDFMADLMAKVEAICQNLLQHQSGLIGLVAQQLQEADAQVSGGIPVVTARGMPNPAGAGSLQGGPDGIPVNVDNVSSEPVGSNSLLQGENGGLVVQGSDPVLQ